MLGRLFACVTLLEDVLMLSSKPRGSVACHDEVEVIRIPLHVVDDPHPCLWMLQFRIDLDEVLLQDRGVLPHAIGHLEAPILVVGPVLDGGGEEIQGPIRLITPCDLTGEWSRNRPGEAEHVEVQVGHLHIIRNGLDEVQAPHPATLSGP